MIKTQTKIRITAIGQQEQHLQVGKNTTKLKVTAVAIPDDNPYGKDFAEAQPFEIEVYNNNIINLHISQRMINQVFRAELFFLPIKPDAAGNVWRVILNQLK